IYSGPLYEAMSIEGDHIIIAFKHSGSGLKVQGDTLKGFAIAGQDKQWFWADAQINSPNTVIVHSAQLEAPVAVRYSWANNPLGNLYNPAGLPASPFRTDDWLSSTKSHSDTKQQK
ncbi:MAG: 9-O-acetylesterase, partial [Pseudomonadota bacterium]|nr:9-O-acetylesterase [Pseudomonadota bacterium]